MRSEQIAFTQSGDGPPLLLIHGSLTHGGIFAPLRPYLASIYRLIMPDLRGYGASQALPPPYSPQQHAEDLLNLIDSLQLEQIALFGYSQGGTIAQQFAYRYPERVTRLGLVCTYAYNLGTWREWLEARLMLWLLRGLGVARLAQIVTDNADELTPEQKTQFRAIIASTGPSQAIASLQAIQTFDSRAWLSAIHCPTVIIAGAQDHAVPLHHAHQLHRGIPNAQLVVIEGAKHTLLWTHTERLAQVILGG